MKPFVQTCANLTQGLSTILQVSTAGFANPPYMVLAQCSSSKQNPKKVGRLSDNPLCF